MQQGCKPASLDMHVVRMRACRLVRHAELRCAVLCREEPGTVCWLGLLTWQAYTRALNAMKIGRSEPVGMLRAWW